MAFPRTKLDLQVELFVDGAWSDITGDVRTSQDIEITRGRDDEGATADPGRCSFKLNNRHGRYSPRNPVSPLYGLIGRNTPVRCSVHEGDPYLATPGTAVADAGAATPDAAALDITGDIDIRIDATMSNWVTSGILDSVELAGKFRTTPGAQRSWLLMMRDGRPYFEWSADGTAVLAKTATADLPLPAARRRALRVTLDVDNGAAGNTVTFYTAPGIAGPWTQLGDPVVTAGTTSVFNSTAEVRVGDGSTDVGFLTPAGGVNAFQLRDGIDGTLVADVDFTLQTPGAASFVDDTGKTWTIGSSSAISNQRVRFVGEVPAWPARWDRSGNDRWVPIQAQGVLRRLGQGAAPLNSAMRREFASPGRTGIVAYWPCEDGGQATVLSSALADGSPLAISSGSIDAGSYSDWKASAPLPTMGDGVLAGAVAAYTPTTGTNLRFFARAAPDGVGSTQRLIALTCTGTAATWRIWIDDGGALAVRAYDSAGSQILDAGLVAFNVNGRRLSIGLQLVQNGADIDWELLTFSIDDDLAIVSDAGTLAGRTVGVVTGIAVGEDAALGETAIGHIAIGSAIDAFASTAGALLGWAGETTRSRMIRLGAEEQIPIAVYGHEGAATALGGQGITTFLGLLAEAAQADGGILYEQRDTLGLAYRTRASLYNQIPLALDYAAGHISEIEPNPDDQHVRNDLLVQREGGSSVRAVQESGPLSVSAPPAGVGRYDEEITLSLDADGQLAGHARWRLHLGTWDEERYPEIRVDLAANPALIGLAESDVGDRITVANPPPGQPPDDIDVLGVGYTETLSASGWSMEWNAVPGGPWRVAELDSPDYGRLDSLYSTLDDPVDETGTSLFVAVEPDRALWTTDPAEFPFDVAVGGERMTVTDITGASSPQTFTVVRSVNGVVKPHAAGTPVRLFQPAAIPL